jgi:hypothetical protein
VTHPTLLRITRVPVGRRASGFVLVAQWQPINSSGVDQFSLSTTAGSTRDLCERDAQMHQQDR